jgi:hypothetical protein
VFSLLLTEFGDFPMMPRMLLGIKQRAEQQGPVDPSAPDKAGAR